MNIFVLVPNAQVSHTSDFKRKYMHLYLCLYPPTSWTPKWHNCKQNIRAVFTQFVVVSEERKNNSVRNRKPLGF